MDEKGQTRQQLVERIERAARSLRRQELFLAFVSLAVGAAYLAVMIGWGSVRLRDWAGRPGEGSAWALVFWYLLFFTLLYNVVHFPVSYLRGYVVERRFRLSRQRFRRWLWAEAKKYLVSAVLVVFMGEFLYLFLRRSQKTWWFWAWLAYVVFGLFLSRYGSRVILPLFYKREDLADEPLKERLKALVERAGFRVKAVKRIVLGKDTSRANAAVAGLGGSKEILVSDTLLGLLSADEIEAVTAHELAHARRLHGEILLVVGTAVSFVGFVLAAAALSLSARRLGLDGVADVAGFPLIVAVFAGLYLVLSPLLNYFSRDMERAADLWAGRFTGAPLQLASAIEKLAANNLSQKDQPRYYEILFASHPSPSRRVAYLKQFAARMASHE